MKIGIADPQARVRFSLRVLLEQQAGWMVILEAADRTELLSRLRADLPDLLLIDWGLPDQPAGNLMRQLRDQYPDLLILSMSGKQELGPTALKSGANAFICKTESPLKLLKLIKELRARVK